MSWTTPFSVIKSTHLILLHLLVELHHCLQPVTLIKFHSFMLDYQILGMLQDEHSHGGLYKAML